ncbi:dihydroorotate dehydrogenase electron transfer subunit [Pontibacillus salipaludis]|uniref:dihydroorotate dehydrogenase electron transfer subunit n=1 Tax=Pontibacillus salipaludis TaxID=1697394 RepID=UPI0031EF47FB
MLKKDDMHILQNKWIAYNTFEMKLTGRFVNLMKQPGQFLHIKVGDGTSHVLRRPLSIANVDHHIVTVIYKIVGKGTKWLSERKIGETVDVIGPRGRGFPIEGIRNEHIVLIGGGVGVPPLYYLGRKLVQQGNTVTSILGFQGQDGVFYEDAFRQLGETLITTDDGSHGYKGRVTDLIGELDQDVTQYFSCGPKPMLKGVSETFAIPGFISLEERMGCGVGACFACVCETTDPEDSKGYRKICQDGPVFRSGEVVL